MTTRSAHKDAQGVMGDRVVLTRVTKRWGSRAVLEAQTFVFEPGVTYVIAGRSGAGKTTLLNLLAGYLQPDQGTVHVAGIVGYLFQDETLFSSLTARENVMLRAAVHTPREEMARTVDHCLRLTNMVDRGDDPVAVLSGGERQRVEFASMLASAPDLVLLDEPTASLDPEARRQVAGLIADVFGHATCVLVTHDEHLADEIGDAVRLRLVDGELIHA